MAQAVKAAHFRQTHSRQRFVAAYRPKKPMIFYYGMAAV
jgi:hypothetical protein